MTGQMTAPVALLACPFCGGSPEGFKTGKTGTPLVEELTEDAGGGWRVMCYTCSIHTSNGAHKTADSAIAAWNTRPAQPAASEVDDAVDFDVIDRLLDEHGCGCRPTDRDSTDCADQRDKLRAFRAAFTGARP